MITPVITPVIIPINHEKPLCPECGKPEDIKRVCSHCGHEYKEEPFTKGESWALFFIIAFALWLLITVGAWLMSIEFEDDASLLKTLKWQLEYLHNIRLK